MATQWWELAIPAGATLFGVGISVVGTLATGSAQRRHDRRAHLATERKEAYIRFRMLAHKVRERIRALSAIEEQVQSIDIRQEENRNYNEKLREQTEQLRNLRIAAEKSLEAAEPALREARKLAAEGRKDEAAKLLSELTIMNPQELTEPPLTEGTWHDLESELADVGTRLAHTKKVAEEWSEEFRAAESIVAFLGSEEVRLAAVELMIAVFDAASSDEVARLDEAFVRAVRRDLKV